MRPLESLNLPDGYARTRRGRDTRFTEVGIDDASGNNFHYVLVPGQGAMRHDPVNK